MLLWLADNLAGRELMVVFDQDNSMVFPANCRTGEYYPDEDVRSWWPEHYAEFELEWTWFLMDGKVSGLCF